MSDTLDSVTLGSEFVAALDKAEAVYLAGVTAQRAYEDHFAEHGCEVDGPFR